ncbi:hypothetical protein MT325_m466R [Paramecium bursaria chlorella virus MT325]|uniref:Uncharacterized protein m466R n=1 Tax=Paramecium bursaria Chlorella virus MT325 TaxID=346932 RepID=A7IUJ6_PBCVM|nr:hypothetical protein MT325_m466R [Paramecium bursaria chlorella virus MT325]
MFQIVPPASPHRSSDPRREPRTTPCQSSPIRVFGWHSRLPYTRCKAVGAPSNVLLYHELFVQCMLFWTPCA